MELGHRFLSVVVDYQPKKFFNFHILREVDEEAVPKISLLHSSWGIGEAVSPSAPPFETLKQIYIAIYRSHGY